MKTRNDDTALVVIDPQNDVLSEKGVSWSLVGDSVKENNTIANIECRIHIPSRDSNSSRQTAASAGTATSRRRSAGEA